MIEAGSRSTWSIIDLIGGSPLYFKYHGPKEIDPCIARWIEKTITRIQRAYAPDRPLTLQEYRDCCPREITDEDVEIAHQKYLEGRDEYREAMKQGYQNAIARLRQSTIDKFEDIQAV